MSKIILYSTGCPLCTKLESKLDKANINYEINNDVNKMAELDFETVPMLEVDGKFLDFGAAVKWIKETVNGN